MIQNNTLGHISRKDESFNLRGYVYHSFHNRTIYNSLNKENKCKKAKWLSEEPYK